MQIAVPIKQEHTRQVFLGGTCNSSNWRESLIKLLTVPYYNPVVPDWTPDCIDEELRQRATCRLCLYVITPAMSGVYSIAELVEDSIKSPNRTIVCFLREDGEYMFGDKQWKSLEQVSALVSRNGARVLTSLEECAASINLILSEG